MPFRFYECSRNSCRFRFPVEQVGPADYSCPHCGAAANPAANPAETLSAGHAKLPREPGMVALLDNIRSILNVGAIFRIADGAGVDHLHLCGITATPAHPRVAKTGLGAEEAVAWSHHRNGVRAGEMLRHDGYQLWALENSPQAISLAKLGPLISGEPIALVVGNEKAGVDPGILALCEQVFFIPMAGRKHSLNVAVAFGIAAYHLRFAVAGSD